MLVAYYLNYVIHTFDTDVIVRVISHRHLGLQLPVEAYQEVFVRAVREYHQILQWTALELRYSGRLTVELDESKWL